MTLDLMALFMITQRIYHCRFSRNNTLFLNYLYSLINVIYLLINVKVSYLMPVNFNLLGLWFLIIYDSYGSTLYAISFL